MKELTFVKCWEMQSISKKWKRVIYGNLFGFVTGHHMQQNLHHPQCKQTQTASRRLNQLLHQAYNLVPLQLPELFFILLEMTRNSQKENTLFLSYLSFLQGVFESWQVKEKPKNHKSTAHTPCCISYFLISICYYKHV